MDSRKAHINTEQPNANRELDEEIQVDEDVFKSVPVDVLNTVSVLSQKAANSAYDIYASYATYILAPSAAGIPTVAQLLPQDGLRIQGVVKTANANVVLCKTKDQAQATGNLQATTGVTNFPGTPQGALISPSQAVPALENNETLWVVNCDPTLTAYVSVIIERGGA
jgi:hypothetical protein